MFSGDLDALASRVAAATAAATAALKANGYSSHVNAERVTNKVESKTDEDDGPARKQKRPKLEDAATVSSEGQPEEDDEDEDEGETAYLRYMSSVLGPFPKQLSDARDFEVP